MFTLASGFYENYFIPPEVSLLMIGLDGAGKTTLLERLKVTDFKSAMKVRSGKRISVKPVVDIHHKQKQENGSGHSSSNTGVLNDGQSQAPNGTHKNTTSEQDLNLKAMQNDRHSNDTDSLIAKDGNQTKRRLMCPAPKAYRSKSGDNDIEYQYENYDGEDSHHEHIQHKKSYDHVHGTSNGSLAASNYGEAGIVPLPISNITSTPIAPHPPIVARGTERTYVADGSHEDTQNETVNGAALSKQFANGSTYDSSSIQPTTNETNSTSASIATSTTTQKNKKKQKPKNYDQKPNTKMFPIHLIRPTVGMNLAKFEAFNAKVRLMDLGGSIKMRNLWERYYKDIHGVVFVVDVSKNASVAKLMEARAFYRCMLDDESLRNVPILIFANKLDERLDDDGQGSSDERDDSDEGKVNGSTTSRNSFSIGDSNGEINGSLSSVEDDNGGVLGDTSLLDIAELFLSPPRGSPTSNINFKNVALFAGSAKSGEGVRPAFEWLIRMGAFLVKAHRRASV